MGAGSSSINGFYQGGSTTEKNRLYLAYRPSDPYQTATTADYRSDTTSEFYGTNHTDVKVYSGGGTDFYEKDFFALEDKFYFLSPGSSEFYAFGGQTNTYFGTTSPWPWGKGGITLTILNEGEWTRTSNFRKNSKINNRDVWSSANAARFETNGMERGNGYYFYPKTPNTVDASVPSTDPYYYKQSSNDGKGLSGADSIEFFQQRSGVWDTISMGLYTGAYDDCCYFGLSNVTCQTIIKIELLCSSGAGNRMGSGFQIGDSDWVESWSLTQIIDDDILADPKSEVNTLTESNGKGNHGFILFHPMTGQFIANNTIDDSKVTVYDPSLDMSIDSIPDDIIFYSDAGDPDMNDFCPYNAESTGSKDILAFKHDGENNTQGELQSVIFYDKEESS